MAKMDITRTELVWPGKYNEDFSSTAFIGEEEVEIEKEQSLLEEKAYRDTWANGVDSYVAMLFPRLQLMRGLLSPKGNSSFTLV